MEVRSELWCHGCDSYVQFTLDDSLDGNHRIVCPKCGHLHYRFVRKGEVTGERYFPGYATNYPTSISYTSTSTYVTYSSGATTAATGNTFTYQSWMNTTGTGG